MNRPERLPIRRALVSVFDKAGLERLAAALGTAGVEVVSTGSTATALEGHGLAVTRVEELTGFPELLDGRVKTLHPKVHAGLLADRAQPGHQTQLEEAGIAPFDLVVVNLYPFEETVSSPDADPALAIERIDIGGPAMVRAAAKNHSWVAVVCDPDDYPLVETALSAGGTTLPERRALAAKAFTRTAAYDTAVAEWMGTPHPGRTGTPQPERTGAPEPGWTGTPQPGAAVPDPPVGEPSPAERAGGHRCPQPPQAGLPERLAVEGRLRQRLRYGENPHQEAAFYAVEGPGGPWGLGAARQVAGKELSYNNLLDADAALALAAEHGDRPFAVIVKHTNPCGAAFGSTLEEAYAGALAGDPQSAYGGVVGLSRPLDAATAERIAGIFTEVVVAPGFDDEALTVLAGKPSLRLVEAGPARPDGWLSVRSVAGGLLAQEPDPGADDPAAWDLEAGAPPGPELLADLALAWSVAAHVKSNAIVLARDGRVVGVGAGQQSRVDSVRIAVAKAGERARGAAAGSDAFFPFPDGVEALAAAGVVAVAQPGGSVRDPEVTAAAAAAGMAMLHTGRRHFRH
ncbi:MAG TPA: bifunctional phosphoribosylaminoimidazolecarboxamide formyltransferase/IMP cyclohydrolase [Actinomycetota bacterium]|nr:bifunctional phosphoribosylaminoimidazolecarboxamide formyltransferase/IMP cyclohydrolase [Actinomycetota bacterium]